MKLKKLKTNKRKLCGHIHGNLFLLIQSCSSVKLGIFPSCVLSALKY